MEPAARMFISSTYWSDTIGLRAALTTLKEARRRNVSSQLWKFGAELKSSLNAAAAACGLSAECIGIDVHPAMHFKVPDEMRSEVTTLYIQEMAKRGCHGYASFYLNAAQGSSELEQTTQAAKETFTIIAESIAANNVASKLECSLQKDAFRRLVR
jgi:glutamate-1-semialdehyde aminotransferase